MNEIVDSLAINIEVQTESYLFNGHKPSVTIASGLTVLVGPNGAGKTQVLRGLRSELSNHLSNCTASKVRYLSAGRASPLERFRAKSDNPHNTDNSPTYVGNAAYGSIWYDFESLTGDYLVLEQRADLRLKVQARLQAFLSRSIQLTWGQNGLEIRIVPNSGATYLANNEASGILQLAPLLAAIYNEEVGALLIDEPEISLHPQYQAFVMQELQSVAGNPLTEPGKKLVIIATHSPNMLALRSASDLPSMVFFNDQNTPPIQIVIGSGVLNNVKLKALISRLTATHRLAFFARNVLLVEGPSDEIITSQLARALQHPLLAANTQIVPVIGKPEFVDAINLFELMGKRVFVLADLDALTDSNVLVNKFSTRPEAKDAALAVGHNTLVELDYAIRSKFSGIVQSHWNAIQTRVSSHPYWVQFGKGERTDQVRRRVTLAFLMSNGGEELDALIGSSDFVAIKKRFAVLFEALEDAGCFILQKGTVEDYYRSTNKNISKIEAAALEAESFEDASFCKLKTNYSDIVRAIKAAAPIQPVDENLFLRERLGGVLGAIFQFMETGTPSSELNSRARSSHAEVSIFNLENCSSLDELKVRVSINSPLFQRDTFPFEVSINENLTKVIRAKLTALS